MAIAKCCGVGLCGVLSAGTWMSGCGVICAVGVMGSGDESTHCSVVSGFVGLVGVVGRLAPVCARLGAVVAMGPMVAVSAGAGASCE